MEVAPVFLFLLFFSVAAAVVPQNSVRCLRGLKDSLTDPSGILSSWSFANTSAGSVCGFSGISCWNPQENRVVDLRLTSMGLSGTIPSALQYCSEATTLDLSGNSLSGPIPSGLCDWIPYLVTLDLSKNSLDGEIPRELANCRFLNRLLLNGNRLSGAIPTQLGTLDRLKEFSVADNSLTGSIPAGLTIFGSSSFHGNTLCGRPLRSCGGLSKTSLIIIIAAGIFGAAASLLLAYGIWRWCFFTHPKPCSKKKGGATLEGGSDNDNHWVEALRPYRLIQVTLFHKPIVKIKLGDILAATNGFDRANVVSSGRTGKVYKAVLRDGSALAVKRLSACVLSEKQFHIEMGVLGQLRHPNLVPLLGFSVIEEERLLIYKHMPGGTLYNALNPTNGSPDVLDWRARLKIGIGAARGLAWLHHGIATPLIHHNICSSVILLDDDYEARITDIGLAKLLRSSGSAGSAAFRDGEFGELGYIPPEYSTTMVASLKGDVYAFGVVLLELVTGKKPLNVIEAGEGFKGNLVDWVNYLSSTFRIADSIPDFLLSNGRRDEIMQFLRVVTECVASRPKDRSSMYEVYQSLKAIGENHDFSDQFDEFPLLHGKDNPGLV